VHDDEYAPTCYSPRVIALEVLLLSVGLAMDAVAVALARGLAVERVRAGQVARIALLFGGFQAGFAALGWLAGSRTGAFVARWDHWIAFALLAGLGVKMIVGTLRGGVDEEAEAADVPDPFRFTLLVPLAIATSLDAMAAGLTLPLLAAPVLVSLVAIGGVTLVLCAAAARAARRLGAALGTRVELLGGLILIAIGTKILVAHLIA
jgi:putative Mn2+ efflux pump MntP